MSRGGSRSEGLDVLREAGSPPRRYRGGSLREELDVLREAGPRPGELNAEAGNSAATSPPGIDRHTHLEGSLDPSWVQAEARRRGLAVPAGAEALWRGEAQSFDAFIDAFLFAAAFLTDAGAVEAALLAASTRLPTTADGCRGLDVWLSPHFLVVHRKQLTLDALWRGLESGIDQLKSQGVQVAIILDAVNHFGPSHGHAVLNLVGKDLPPFVRGFSTGGLERVSFREWAPVFDRARDLGLRIAAHAGENGPGSNVREAILEGGVERIVHGVRGADDQALLELLAERRIPVDVCPTSNQALIPDLGPHPLPRMLAAGVRCALGTDDPGVIPCTLHGEWQKAEALGVDPAGLILLARYAAEDAWCLPRSVVESIAKPR